MTRYRAGNQNIGVMYPAYEEDSRMSTNTETELDNMLTVLASTVRRDIVTYLAEVDEADAGLLAAYTDADLTAMRHVHLPMLADHDIIGWDGEYAVETGPAFERAARLCRAVTEA